jgi:hypothetical protein
LDFHKDGSIISFNILLNDSYSFNGGGTKFKFDDGVFLYKLEKGDMLLHYGEIEHSGEEIITGVRYLLVGFINYMDSYRDYEYLLPSPVYFS